MRYSNWQALQGSQWQAACPSSRSMCSKEHISGIASCPSNS